MDRLFRIQDVIPSGVSPDLPPERAPFWLDAQDVIFKDGGVSPYPGYQRLLTNTQVSPVVGILEATVAGVPTLFWGSKSDLFRYDATNGVSNPGTGYTGIEDQTSSQFATAWSLVRWGEWTIGTNGVNAPQIRKVTSFGALSGVTFNTAEIFIRYRDFLLALNTNNMDDGFEWCKAGDPETWTPALGNNAGNLRIRDLGSPIRAGLLCGGNVLAYGDSRAAAINFVNAPFYFGARPVLEGIGAFSKRSVCQVGNLNFGICKRGVFRTDGVSFDWIDRPSPTNPNRAIHSHIFSDINVEQTSKVVVWHNRALQLILISYPSASSLYNDKCVAYDYIWDLWIPSLSRVPNAGSDEGVFNFPIVGFRDGGISIQDTENTLPGNEGSPLDLTAKATLTCGYGEGGYGCGGYGGEIDVTG